MENRLLVVGAGGLYIKHQIEDIKHKIKCSGKGYNYIAGCSSGAIAGAYMASVSDYQSLEELGAKQLALLDKLIHAIEGIAKSKLYISQFINVQALFCGCFPCCSHGFSITKKDTWENAFRATIFTPEVVNRISLSKVGLCIVASNLKHRNSIISKP